MAAFEHSHVGNWEIATYPHWYKGTCERSHVIACVHLVNCYVGALAHGDIRTCAVSDADIWQIATLVHCPVCCVDIPALAVCYVSQISKCTDGCIVTLATPIYEDATQTRSIRKNGKLLDDLWRLVFLGFHRER